MHRHIPFRPPPGIPAANSAENPPPAPPDRSRRRPSRTDSKPPVSPPHGTSYRRNCPRTHAPDESRNSSRRRAGSPRDRVLYRAAARFKFERFVGGEEGHLRHIPIVALPSAEQAFSPVRGTDGPASFSIKEPHPQLKHPRKVCLRGNLPERRRPERRVRPVELRRIRQIEHLAAELGMHRRMQHLLRERLEHREIDIGDPRPRSVIVRLRLPYVN